MLARADGTRVKSLSWQRLTKKANPNESKRVVNELELGSSSSER